MPDPDKDFPSLLAPVLAQMPLEIGADQMAALHRQYELLQKWNRRINLTAIREPEQIIERHFGESLFLATILGEARTVVDIGSGAGFPGVPLAVARPEIQVTLVESVGKKVSFLKEVVRPIANASVYHGRAENLQERFDCAVCRGVALKGVLASMRRISGRAALLVTKSGAEQLVLEENANWDKPVRLPWGDERVALVGSLNRLSY